MRRAGPTFSVLAMVVVACSPSPPPGSMALDAADREDPVPAPRQLADEPAALAPEPSDDLPVALATVAPDATPEQLAALLARLSGTQVGGLPEPTGEPGRVELAEEPPARFGLLSGPTATTSDQRGLGAAAPSELAWLAEAHPELLRGALVVPAAGGPSYTLAALPPKVDLRPRMPPVRDQGARGTCVYFATAGSLDHLYARRAEMPIKTGAPQQMYWLYHATVVKQMFPAELWRDNGANPWLFCRILSRQGSASAPISPPNTGYVAERACPYDSGLAPDSPSADPDAMALKHLKRSLYSLIKYGVAVPSQGAEFAMVENDGPTIRRLLAAGRTVILGLPVNWGDWHVRPPAWRIGEYHTGKPIAGYHMVCLVGYEADPKAPGGGWYLLRNSWSDRWADRGHARISYDHIRRFGLALLTPERANGPYSTRFTLTPRPSPTPTPRPTPAGDPSEDAHFWTSPSLLLAKPYWGRWRAYEHVTSPEWGYSVERAPIGGWKSAGAPGRTGDFPLDVPRFRISDGTQYRIQVRGRDGRGVMRYSPMVGLVGGMFVDASPSPAPPPSPSPAPSPAPSQYWWDNPDFSLHFDPRPANYLIAYNHRKATRLSGVVWGYAVVATAEERPTITSWQPVDPSGQRGSWGEFYLPHFMNVRDGKLYRIQVRANDESGRVHLSAMMLIAGGSFR